MVYLVGGPSRAGKTALARFLLHEQRIPFLPLDVLKMGLYRAYPDFGRHPEDDRLVRGRQIWPIVRAMAINLIEQSFECPDYLMEGDTLLPAEVSELAAQYPDHIRACFLGYPHLRPAEKLRQVRESEPDWGTEVAEDVQLEFVNQEIVFSRRLSDECVDYGLEFFDSGLELASAVAAAATHLLSE